EVLAGRSHFVVAANIGAIPFLKDPRVRMLGVTGARRSRFLPGLPAIGESLPGYVFDSWMGLLGPAHMAPPVVAEINSAMAKLLQDPAMLDKLAKQGIEPRAMAPQEFAALLRIDYEKMARVVKASGARID
ncbi:MAG: tripartite tricarboxylate transporter substrate binding protein, partial [Betaproteobacteria bacterium]|nr:tripartite tricarboxylate transporter substrate binding protein [Betaproteobacteria bacterium]